MPVIHTHVSVSTTPEQREALKITPEILRKLVEGLR